MNPVKVIKILQRKTTIPGDGYLYDEIDEAIEFAIKEVGKCIPVKPLRKSWSPNRCPTCNANLGGKCDDGYFENPFYEHCPECRQMLDYNY